MSRLIGLVVALMAVGGALAVAGATAPAHAPSGSQVATPSPGRDVPGSEECRVEPRTLASLEALTTPVAGAPEPTPPSGTPAALPVGEPLDAATLAAITATAREVIACRNAGEALRTLALYSDAFLRQYFASPGTFTPERYAAMATPRPLSPETRVALLDVREARRLPDGRAGATVVVEDPADPTGQPRSATFLFFVEQDGRWLVDGAIEGLATTATPTP